MNADTLVVTGGPAAGTQLEVTDELLIGRLASGPGTLGDDPELSRRHALISRTAAGLAIADLGSTNGTRVNGQVIDRLTALRAGDRIELGGSAIEVEAAIARPAAAAAAVAPFSARVAHQRAAGGGRSRTVVALAVVAAAAIAAAIVLAVTRPSDAPTKASVAAPAQDGPSTGPVSGSQYDGTAYVETNVPKSGRNAVMALDYRDGSFAPLRLAEYPTGGMGSHDLDDGGVLDADQQVITNADHTLLFAINQGSDTVAVFRIAADGSLSAVSGSPFASGGLAPGSLGISDDILIVANKAHDGIRDLTHKEANYTTFRVQDDGRLEPTGSTVVLPPGSSPTQVYVAPGGRLVFTTEESGVFRAFRLTADGALMQAPNSPVSLPDSLFNIGPRPDPVWPAGLVANGPDHILYSGLPNYGTIVAYRYDDAGDLTFASQRQDPGAFLPCWSVINRAGTRLYFANAATGNVSVWDIGSKPERPRLLQTAALRGGGNPWNLQLSPDGKHLFIITPRQVKSLVPAGQGQLLHSLDVASDGKLSERPDSPVTLPVALGTNPLGLAVVPH